MCSSSLLVSLLSLALKPFENSWCLPRAYTVPLIGAQQGGIICHLDPTALLYPRLHFIMEVGGHDVRTQKLILGVGAKPRSEIPGCLSF